MGKKIRWVVTIVLAAALIVGLAVIGWKMLDYWKGAQDYADAEEIAGLFLPDQPWEGMEETQQTEDAPEVLETDYWAAVLGKTDLNALREINSDVVGWLTIPDTEVSYPIVQTEDNSYYLNHTWKKENSSVGGIFLECKNPADLSSFNTIIYGHNMRNGSMFGTLKDYMNEEYWEEHPSVYIVTDDGVYRYDIFAAFESGIREVIYRLNIESGKQKEELIQFSLSRTTIDTGIVPDAEDSLLTLSTCTGRGHATRWVVQGVLHGGRPFSKDGTMVLENG